MTQQLQASALYIDGQPLTSGEWIDVCNPAAPEETVGRLAVCDESAVRRATEAASRAQRGWAALPLIERIEAVLDAVSAEHGPELGALLTAENGKVGWEALADSASFVSQAADTASYAVEALAQQERNEDDRRIVVQHRPAGVVAVIVPFNWPVTLAAAQIIPALISGNAVVVKPPLDCPLTLTDIVARVAARLPRGVLNIVAGPDDTVGRALVTAPLVQQISFVGSAPSAVRIASSLTDIKRLSFELGGNDAAVFLEDAVLDERAIRDIVMGTTITSGQLCFALKRAYVHRSRASEFVELLSAAYDQQVVGDGRASEVTMGPLINERAYNRVRGLVASARDSGAEVRALGRQTGGSTGYFIQPTIVVNPAQDSPIVQTEQFAPVLPVIAFDNVDDAISQANDSPYGLCSSVWTADEARAFAVAERFEAGTTFINSHSMLSIDPRAPFGGVKQSGVGRINGPAALMEYTGTHVLTRVTF